MVRILIDRIPVYQLSGINQHFENISKFKIANQLVFIFLEFLEAWGRSQRMNERAKGSVRLS
jgi:hypothetical protein